MAFLTQSLAYNRMIFLVNACDHLTKAISIASIAATLSKNAGAFGAAGGSVSEVGSGWYKLTMTTTDTGTIGDLAVHVKDATGKVDDTDFVDQVIALNIANATFPTNFSALSIDASGRVDNGKWMGSSLASCNVAGVPTMDLARWLGSIPNALIAGRVDSNATLSGAVDNYKWVGTLIPAPGITGVPTVDIARWLGSIPNSLIGGRVDASATLPSGVPTNFAAFKLDTSGRVDLGAWLGSSLASVPVSGIPQVDIRRWLGSIPNSLIAGRVDADASGVAVTVGTNNDKTGYTASTVSDKTGYSLAASGLFIKKNTQLASFMFMMIDSTDHVTPKTGLTITGQVSIDGAALATLTNAVSELSNGIYKVTLAAADVNGTSLMLRFTATGADARLIPIITQA